LFGKLRAALAGNLLPALLLVSLVPLLVLGITVYQYASQLHAEQAAENLTATRTLKATQVEHYFKSIHEHIRVFSESLMVIDAMRSFSDAFSSARDDAGVKDAEIDDMRQRLREFYATEFKTRYRENTGEDPEVEALVDPLDDNAIFLQYQYIVANENPLGRKDRLDAADDGSRYSEVHARYHRAIRRFGEAFGYYDVFLVDEATGNIVYSIFKEVDFATSARRGYFSNSGLAKTFARAADAGWKDFVAFNDYAPYEPSYGAAASFIASPIYDAGERIGVAVFQMPIDRIDEIMEHDVEGSASTEVYAVGSDSLIRNNVVDEVGPAARLLETRVTTIAARLPFADEGQREGVGIFEGRSGQESMQSWGPVVVHPASGGEPAVTWALIAEKPMIDVERPTRRIFWFTALVTATSALLVAAVSWAISRRFTNQSRRQQTLVQAIGENTSTLASASEELTSVSEHMSAAAEQTTAQARVVSEAADHVRDNTQGVAEGLENFSVSVNDVAKSAGEAASVANRAVVVAKTADDSIKKLGESSQRIGEIVSVITTIAEQTNLLALNATIEAARAGDAGKGFAVVAGEVKELAKETGAATKNIRDSIDQIREDTSRAVEAIGDITRIVHSICEQENTIAAAVEEQTSTTAEISRNVAEAAAGTSQIAQNMTQVAQAAQSTAEGASNTQSAAVELARMASGLQRLVDEYEER
jgi:methyl-accepting chemotaxis protein